MTVRTPRQHRLATAQGDLVWYEWGMPGNGPSVLLLHATGFHGRIWDQVSAHMPDDVHLIVPDQRGHGLSYKPDSLADWPGDADDVITLLEQVAEGPALVVGHSKGATVSVFAAARRPDLFRNIVLIDPVIVSPDAYLNGVDPASIDPDAHPVARRRNIWDGADVMATYFASRTPYNSWVKSVLDDFCRYGLAPAPSGNGFELACPPRLEASVYLGSILVDPAPYCAQVPCRVTVVRGRSGDRASMMDFSVSPTRPDLASLFPHGTDLQWAENSHFIPMEAPDRVAALITAVWNEGSQQ